jgi:hypothetical protein
MSSSRVAFLLSSLVCALAVLHLCYSVYEDRLYQAAAAASAGIDAAYRVPIDVRLVCLTHDTLTRSF